MAADDRDMLLLADQATYCLAGGCRLCPRYRAAQAMATHGRVDSSTAAEVAGGVLASDQLRPELMAIAGDDEAIQTRRRWAWMSTAVVFIAMMLCGASLATYSGWQQVQSFLDERQAGSVQSVASGDVALAPQFLVLTAIAPQIASAAPVVEAQSDTRLDQQSESAIAPLQSPENNQAQVYPPAVTPTPQSGPVNVPLIVVEPQPTKTPPKYPSRGADTSRNARLRYSNKHGGRRDRDQHAHANAFGDADGHARDCVCTGAAACAQWGLHHPELGC